MELGRDELDFWIRYFITLIKEDVLWRHPSTRLPRTFISLF